MANTRKRHPDVPLYTRCERCAHLVYTPEHLPFCGLDCKVAHLPYLRLHPSRAPQPEPEPPFTDPSYEASPEPLPDWVQQP